MEGWPPSQIVVFDNTGLALENSAGTNARDQPTYLNYSHLQQTYGVAIYKLLVRHSFSQGQNALLRFAQIHELPDFFWAHQDILVRSESDASPSLYDNIITMKRLLHEKFLSQSDWAFVWFDYDNLSHVNVAAASAIGLWDIFIPYYFSDCDYYRRARQHHLAIVDFYAGPIWSLAGCVDQHLWTDPSRLDTLLPKLVQEKRRDESGRSRWQGMLPDGKRTDDFGEGFQAMVEAGKRVFKLKWGTYRCA